MVAIGLAVDAHRPVVSALVIPVAIAILVAQTGVLVFVTYRPAGVRGKKFGLRGALSMVGFVWVVVGLALGIGFALRAAAIKQPATIAAAVGGLMMIAEGPVLGRWLRYRMLGRRAISDHWRRPKTSKVRLLVRRPVRLLVRLLARMIKAGRRAVGTHLRRSGRSSTGQALSR